MNKIENSGVALLVASFNDETNIAFAALSLKDVQADYNETFKTYFDDLDKAEKRKQFIEFRDLALKGVFKIRDKKTKKTSAKFYAEMSSAEKTVVKTRLWRLGQLIKVTVGKTPSHKKTGKPPRNPPPPPPENNGADFAEGLGSKAPRENGAAWKRLAQLIKAKTGWNYSQFEREALPIIREVLNSK